MKKSGGIKLVLWAQIILTINHRGRRGRDRMVVGFTTTYVISVYHH